MRQAERAGRTGIDTQTAAGTPGRVKGNRPALFSKYLKPASFYAQAAVDTPPGIIRNNPFRRWPDPIQSGPSLTSEQVTAV